MLCDDTGKAIHHYLDLVFQDQEDALADWIEEGKVNAERSDLNGQAESIGEHNRDSITQQKMTFIENTGFLKFSWSQLW